MTKHEYYIKNKDKIDAKAKAYREAHRQAIKENKKRYYLENAEYFKKKAREHRNSKKEELAIKHKEYRINNREKLNKSWKNRYKADPEFRLAASMRLRLNKALKRSFKGGSAVRDLGCSIEFLKQYLESKFQSGMTWENYGLRGWHIDHIIPLASFDLTNREEFLKACHYTNLQPMWWRENLSKGSSL